MVTPVESVTPDVTIMNETTPNITCILEEFDTIVKTLGVFKNNITELQNKIRNLEKNVKKEMKFIKKNFNNNKKKGNKNPSGFAHPTKISKELSEFMNINENSEIARTDVTKALILYIKENKLQDSLNKKRIFPDEKLKKLLGIEMNNELTYFNIQKYMNKHFLNSKKNTIQEE